MEILNEDAIHVGMKVQTNFDLCGEHIYHNALRELHGVIQIPKGVVGEVVCFCFETHGQSIWVISFYGGNQRLAFSFPKELYYFDWIVK